MSTIITRNSADSGSQPSSLVQGELAINVTDGRLFYGSGSGNDVKEFGVTSSYALSSSYAQTASYAPDYLPLTGGTISGTLHQLGTFFPDQIDWFSSSIGYDTGSYILTTTANGLTTYANHQDIASTLAPYIPTVSASISASYAATASYAPAYLPLTGGTITGDVTVNGTASIAFLNVTYESASVIYSSGSNQFGDALNDVQTLWGTVDVKTGPVLVTGSLNVSGGITGSLLGTASYAAQALSSSYALTASYSNTSTSASYALTSSFTLNALSASYALTASYVNPLNQNLIITGSIYIPDNAHSIYFSGSNAASRLLWNNTDGTLDLGLKGGNVTLQIGQEEVVRVVNKTGALLAESAYQAVRLDGAQGNRIKVALAKGDNDTNSLDTLGLVTENIANNQEGFVTTTGLVRGIDTTGTLQGETWADGDALFLSPTTFGALTNIMPIAPSHSIRLGYVVNSNPSVGSIFVKVDNGYELEELHNVYINTASLAYGDLLMRDGNSVWINTKQLSGSYSITGSLTVSGSSTFTNIGPAIFTGSVTSTSDVQANRFISQDGVINVNNSGQYIYATNGNILYLYTGLNGLYINNQANSANNVIISDAGTVQTRGTITAGSPGNDQSIYFGGTNAGLYWAGSGASIAYAVGALQFSSVGSPNNMVLANGGGATFNYGITGSLLGTATTASYVLNAVSASFASTASYYGGSVTTASYASTATSASHALNANNSISSSFASTASYFDGVTKITAGAGISVSPISGKGDVTVSAAGGTTFPYTGSAIISGSLEVSGSVLIQGAGDGFSGPFRAITIDDANYTRQLYDAGTGNTSIDFGNRSLNTTTGGGALNWDGVTGTVNFNLYSTHRIDPATRSQLYTFNAQSGMTLNESPLDAAVVDYDLVYLGNDGQWYQVDQTTDSSTRMLGIVRNVASQTGSVQIEGDVVVSDSPGIYPIVGGAAYGAPVYIRESNGTMMSTSIPVSGYVRLLGYCYYNEGGTEWIMKFRPSNEWVVL